MLTMARRSIAPASETSREARVKAPWSMVATPTNGAINQPPRIDPTIPMTMLSNTPSRRFMSSPATQPTTPPAISQKTTCMRAPPVTVSKRCAGRFPTRCADVTATMRLIRPRSRGEPRETVMNTLEIPPPDPSATSPRYLARASRALLVLATVTVGALLYFGHEVFKPVALALLFAMVLSNAVEGLHRLKLPRAVSAFLMLLILLTGLGAATDALIEPAQKWLASVPSTLQVVERKIRPVERWMHRLEGLTHRAGEMGGAHAAPLSGSEVLSATGATLTDIVTIVILTLFLLSGGPPMLARMAASLGSDLQAVHALRAIDAIRSELGRYYGTIALINV